MVNARTSSTHPTFSAAAAHSIVLTTKDRILRPDVSQPTVHNRPDTTKTTDSPQLTTNKLFSSKTADDPPLRAN